PMMFCERLTENIVMTNLVMLFFFSSRRRHTRFSRDWSSDVCSSDLLLPGLQLAGNNRAGLPAGKLIHMNGGKARSCLPKIRSNRSEERRVGKEWRYRC